VLGQFCIHVFQCSQSSSRTVQFSSCGVKSLYLRTASACGILAGSTSDDVDKLFGAGARIDDSSSGTD